MSRASPFNKRTALGIVVVGAAVFLLFLYALGAGWTGGDRAMGSGHAASKALNGYAALVELLERRGYEVSLSRTPGRLDEEALLVLTPTQFTDPDELRKLLAERRLQGPTLLILPKWFAIEARTAGLPDARKDWVVLADKAVSPEWIDRIGFGNLDLKVARWNPGNERAGVPFPDQVQSIRGKDMVPLVEGPAGGALAAWHDDGGAYEILADWTNRPVPTLADDDEHPWPLVVVAEPDLLNNAGLADRDRARIALDLVEATVDGYNLPVIFDLTLPGLGRSENLLTLAFEPPFLAATLTLLLAAFVIGWRAFVRFGPPRAEGAAPAGGKAQLARDSAVLIERARRLRLVGPPYARLLASRIDRALGLHGRLAPDERAAAIGRGLERRGADAAPYRAALDTLETGRKPTDILRAAQALKTLERTLSR